MTMVMNMLPKNLLFSLPDDLMKKVFDYDSTYRNVFRSQEFERALQAGYMKMKKQLCIEQITYYIEDLILDGQWQNEYGHIDSDNETQNLTPKYDSVDDFIVKTYSFGPVLFYKILPKGATKENCSYLRKPRKFDGYFLHTDTSDEYWEALNPDKYCLGNDVNHVGYVSEKIMMSF
jgi:hypothetical protein